MDPLAVQLNETNDHKLMLAEFNKDSDDILPSSAYQNQQSQRDTQRKFLDDSSMTMQRFVNEMTANDQGTLGQGIITSRQFTIEETSEQS